MIKILDSKIKNFDTILDRLLSKRKNKVQLDKVSVTKIIKDVKKNGYKAVLKYERRFNKNSIIIPNLKQINKAIKSLDPKVKKAIDIAYNRIYKFHSLQKFKNISYIDKLQNKLEYKYIPIDSVARKAVGFGFPLNGPAVYVPTYTSRAQTKANLINYLSS